MSKKRKSDETTPTELPTATVAPPEGGAATAIAEPPVEPKPETGFAERVGQKQPPAPDPFGIAKDNDAGVRFLDDKERRQVVLKFVDKPSQAVIDKVKEAGFRWNPV